MTTSFPASLVPTSLRTAVGNAGGAGTEIPQSLQALAVANAVRMTNAGAKRELEALAPREAQRRAAEMIERLEFPQVPVQRLLLGCRGLGPKKAKRLMVKAGIAYGGNRISALTPRQRESLCDELREGPLSTRVAA